MDTRERYSLVLHATENMQSMASLSIQISSILEMGWAYQRYQGDKKDAERVVVTTCEIKSVGTL